MCNITHVLDKTEDTEIVMVQTINTQDIQETKLLPKLDRPKHLLWFIIKSSLQYYLSIQWASDLSSQLASSMSVQIQNISSLSPSGRLKKILIYRSASDCSSCLCEDNKIMAKTFKISKVWKTTLNNKSVLFRSFPLSRDLQVLCQTNLQ